MHQNFKRRYYHFVVDPALPLLLPLWALYAFGLARGCPELWVSALLALLALALWQKFCRIDIGRNFQALPTLPGGYRTIGQKAQKGSRHKTCRELRRSLIQDSGDAAAGIPEGKYLAITHEAVLRRLERNEQICVESAKPIYKGTLCPILKAQTHNRCRRCKAPCRVWNAAAKQFYLVRFRVNYKFQKEEVS